MCQCTSRSVVGLEGATVWLIAGEGEKPKSYFLAVRFVAGRCDPNSFPSAKFPHLIADTGSLFKKSISLKGMPLLDQVRKESANFLRGFYETKESSIISSLTGLALRAYAPP